jgi:isoleucyl-tRNA synthetase
VITVGGQDHELDAEDLLVAMKPLEGYQVEREGSHAVALEVTIDDDLRAEGWAREIVHAVQAARRDAGLEVSDRIVLTLDGDPKLLAAARAYEATSPRETLAWKCATRSSTMPSRHHRRPRAAGPGGAGLAPAGTPALSAG